MDTSPVKQFLVTYLMPEKCYEEIFVNFHMHVPCLKFVLNKTFGFWILLDTFLAQLPQLLKIVWRRNTSGLSLTSALLQLYAFSCPVVYAVANNFPLFAWGERLFTLVQTAAIVFLILHYRGDTVKVLSWNATLWWYHLMSFSPGPLGLLFLLAYSGVMFLLGSYTSAAVVSVTQASSLAALIASKGVQARTNHCNGHTGQLSTLSVFLSWAGSLGVAFMSLQETGSSLSTLSNILSACLSCVLLAQVLCYSSSSSSSSSSNTTTKDKSE